MGRFYIGNLPADYDEKALEQFIKDNSFRPSSVSVIRDIETGVSRGFGFADLIDGEGPEVVAALNGTLLQGRRLKVSVARPVVQTPITVGGLRR